MQEEKLRKVLVCCVSFMIIFVLTSPLIVSYYYLPNEIKVIVGQQYSLDFEIPIKARILAKDNLVLKDENSTLEGKNKVSLNKPIFVEMAEEGQAEIEISLLGGIPLKTVSIEAIPYQEVIPGGQLIGIEVHSEGVCVMGTGEFRSDDKIIDPCKGILEKGDRIIEVNGEKISSKEDFKEAIEDNEGEKIKLKVVRNEKTFTTHVTPAYSDDEEAYKIGAWIKDTIQGLGTLTYIDPETYSFGALGHGITDSQTHKIIPIEEGTIMTAYVDSIQKGAIGEPGELSGIINTQKSAQLGDIRQNTTRGIFGTMDEEDIRKLTQEAIPIGCQNEIHEGEAIILADLTDEGVQAYVVEIQKVAKYSSEPSKGMVIKIVDERLLELTHGIVQGMSGSPIIQDNKLIGAVSHVFVQDPTKGYGIFVENMLDSDKK